MPKTKIIKMGDVRIGGRLPFVLFAGPCVIESRKQALEVAKAIKKCAAKMKVPFVFKASYDKANRTSSESFRGLGIDLGLDILKEIKETIKAPILTDVHRVEDVERVARVVDVLQVPAFLCRQTDLIEAVARTNKPVNIKKGQFLAPWDIGQAVKKVERCGNHNILLTERGASFGYNHLVTDFRSLAIMRQTGYPVIFDATHSVQLPGGKGTASGGQKEFVPLLARCGAAAGCEGIFMEVHTHPEHALSDGPNMMNIKDVGPLLKDLIAIDTLIQKKR